MKSLNTANHKNSLSQKKRSTLSNKWLEI